MTQGGSPEDRVGDLVEAVLDGLDLDAEFTVEAVGEEIHVDVEGEDLEPLIGPDGKVIDAVQHLAFKVAGGGRAAGPRVVVDAGGYRARRRAALERQGDVAAETALREGRPVNLEPMSAIERKVVHEYLRERGDVETWSEGVEPDRHLVVAPLGS